MVLTNVRLTGRRMFMIISDPWMFTPSFTVDYFNVNKVPLKGKGRIINYNNFLHLDVQEIVFFENKKPDFDIVSVSHLPPMTNY